MESARKNLHEIFKVNLGFTPIAPSPVVNPLKPLMELLESKVELIIDNKYSGSAKHRIDSRIDTVWKNAYKKIEEFALKYMVPKNNIHEYIKSFREEREASIMYSIVINAPPKITRWIDGKQEIILNKLSLRIYKDKLFVYFGADPPYKAQATFSDIIKEFAQRAGNYIGVIFEFKPTFFPFIEWKEIQPMGEVEARERISEAYIHPKYDKLTHDLITKREVDLKWALRIYTTKEGSEFIKNYDLNIPVYRFEHQKIIFREMMAEMTEILNKYGLLTEEMIQNLRRYRLL